MGDVTVFVMAPDEKIYKAVIDADADEKELIDDLVRWLELPIVDERKGEPIEYRISLIGATRIKEGARLRLHRVRRRPVRKIDLYKGDEGPDLFR